MGFNLPEISESPAPAPATKEAAPAKEPQPEPKPQELEVATEEELEPDDNEEKLEENVEDKPQKRIFKVKLDDQEVDVEEDEVIKGYQRATVANKRFMEAASLKKQAENLAKLVSEDPISAYMQLMRESMGEEAAKEAAFKISERFLSEQLKEKLMPEENRKALSIERERDALRKQLEEKDKAAENNRLEMEGKKFFDNFTQGLTSEMEKQGVPDDQDTLLILAPLIRASLDEDYALTPEEAIAIVKEKRTEYQRRLASSLPDDAILADPERKKRINKRILDEVRGVAQSSTGNGAAAPKGPTKPGRRAESAKVIPSSREFFNSGF